MDNLQSIQDEALALIESADSLALLDDVRVKFLGKKGLISAQMKTLGQFLLKNGQKLERKLILFVIE